MSSNSKSSRTLLVLSIRAWLPLAFLLLSIPLKSFCNDAGKGKLSSPPNALSGVIRKQYVDVDHGQVHLRMVRPGTNKHNATLKTGSEHVSSAHSKIPLVLFHAGPGSSFSYSFFMEQIGEDRLVLAFDTPGFGNSTSLPAKPTLEDISAVMAEALETLGYGKHGKGSVDISGYHTGAYIAIDLAAKRPDLVRKVVLLGVPFLPEESFSRFINPVSVNESALGATDLWRAMRENGHPMMPEDFAYRRLIESLKSAPNAWWSFSAVSKYDAKANLENINQPVLLLNTHGFFEKETRAVLPYLKNGRVVEEPGLTHAIFVVGAPVIAEHMRAFLDE